MWSNFDKFTVLLILKRRKKQKKKVLWYYVNDGFISFDTQQCNQTSTELRKKGSIGFKGKIFETLR